ncbi:MAG: hypothetical protein IPO58_24440 [Betaproteobacteria bacterium]|nr:hypothetical protein [Betaproteobacteria bacterium]
MTALLRVSAQDEFHRKPTDAAPSSSLQARVLAALERFAGPRFHARTALLRACTLCFTRLGSPDELTRTRLLARVERWFPATDRALNSELCQLLVYLQSPRVAAAALGLIRNAPTQEEQLDYIRSLRMLRAGWTPELRRDYFAWFNRAAGYRGGSSFAGFLKMIRADALTTLTEPERAALKDVLDAPPRPRRWLPSAPRWPGVRTPPSGPWPGCRPVWSGVCRGATWRAAAGCSARRVASSVIASPAKVARWAQTLRK